MVLLSSIIRVFIRSTFGQKYGIDDGLLAIATLFAVIQEAVILGAVDKGLGKKIDLVSARHVDGIEKSFYTGNILAILVLGLAKLSIASFILRLTPIQRQRQIIFGIVGATILWMALSVFLVALQCNLSHPWALVGEKCTGISARLVVIGLLDIVLEIALFSSTILLVADLQTAFINKAVVIIAFAFRLPLIIAIALRIASFSTSGLTTNFTIAEDLYVVWTVTEINYALISATIPILRPFINSLSTHYGIGAATEYSVSGSRSQGNAYALSTLKSGGGQRVSRFQNTLTSGNRAERGVPLTFESSSNTFAYAGKNVANASSSAERGAVRGKDVDKDSIGSNDSQRMIIRKNVEFTVQRDDSMTSPRR
ncbi:hypothetical protein LTR36_000374 [Oleoguttula mirabilis]|uniref:Rhodopsin domain-containing protein n=1 Tax=Oleoguttula mirabilis TaxID=1507867 RepID=A0AAV9JYQ3_9PEZI|nr:hypothetical protein LTR36_000374 [Oleoguttula mirabilis]